ncbi:MAG: FtsW/RodA/SpoVE family cell cycle protein [Butyricicoccus sp.]|nr:FtsW/RodA/SpoVE family cell cycle protein [Butyricicoccus sp.]
MKKYLPLVREFLQRADMVLFSLCMISSIMGLVVISSAAATLDHPIKYVAVQLAALIIGIGLFVVLTVIDIDMIADKWPILLGVGVVFILALVPFGEGGGTGNTGWIRFFGIGIQPSEVVKVIYIVLMAKHITYLKEYRSLNHVVSVVQLAGHFMLFFGLIVVISSDLGSALIFFFVFVIMLYAAGLKLYWFVLGIAAIAAVAPFAWEHILKDYQKDRIMAPYVPDLVDKTGDGVTWQANQSKLALSSGRLTGTGLYNGTQTQSGSLPAKQTDFIFAVIGEELGMIGCCVVLLLLVLIIIRCIYVGLSSHNTMSMLVCFGVAASMIFQTFENIGMCIGLTPVVGITLPFFSYGGSSTFSMMAAMGLVSGIKYRPKPERFHRYG